MAEESYDYPELERLTSYHKQWSEGEKTNSEMLAALARATAELGCILGEVMQMVRREETEAAEERDKHRA